MLEKCDIIINDILKFKKNNEVKNNDKYFLACIFQNELDLVNDFFIIYSKLIQRRSKKVEDDQKGICSFCTQNTTTYPTLANYSIHLPSYFFNYKANVDNSRLKVCKQCNSYLRSAEYKLENILRIPNVLIIPKLKNNGSYKDFLKIGNTEHNSFEKINKFLEIKNKDFIFDMIVYTSPKGLRHIQKYIENYKAFLLKFDNIKLYDDNNSLNYLFGIEIFKEDSEKFPVNNVFDLENIFKDFFVDIKDNKIKYPSILHFYQIYAKEVHDILKGVNSKTTSIFAKYMYNIFNLIYEINFDAFSKNMLNEIVLNSLIIFQRNTHVKYYKHNIQKRLNYYFMFKKEFLEDDTMQDNDIKQLKGIFIKYHKDDKKSKIDDDDVNKLLNIINKDISLKYYLLGQFIALIDNSKGTHGKKGETFSNFVTNVNRSNLHKFFTTEIL